MSAVIWLLLALAGIVYFAWLVVKLVAVLLFASVAAMCVFAAWCWYGLEQLAGRRP